MGPIPDDWCLRPVGDMGEVITGKALAVDGPGELRPYLRTKNVFDGRIDIDDVLSMPMTEEQFRHFMLQKSDVLLNEGQSLELVGRCAIYGGEYAGPCAIQNQLLRFRAHAGISGLFGSHLFRYCQQKGVFARVALQTTSIAHLGGTRFEQLLLPWPPTEAEQHAIAAALTDVDALLDGLDRLIAKKRGLKQAAMQHLLTGQTRLPGFHGEWEVKRFGELLTYEQPTKYLVSSGEYSDANDVPVLTAGKTFILGYTNEDERIFSDLPVIIFDDFTTASHYVTFPFKVKSSAMKLLKPRNQSIGVRFVYEAMQLIVFKVSEHKRHWISEYQKLELRVPHEEEQAAIIAVMSDMDAELSALAGRRDKTRDVKQAMMQDLLTGKTRLVPAGAVHA